MGSAVPAPPALVAEACELLRAAPTRAPLTLTPDLDPPSGLVGWHPVTRLTEIPFVSDLVAAYSAGLATRHLAVGGACGLQHYAGRFVLAAIGAWVQTSAVPDMDHSAWRVKLDESGHTVSVAPPVTGATHVGTAQDAASEIITAHLGPIVAAVREVSRITERVAHGCIAASCAGTFATLYRRTPPQRQRHLADLADAFLGAPAWPGGRPLVDLQEIDVPTGPALVHQRNVCCLIRLGRRHGACGTCPDIDPDERMTRIIRHATAAARGTDLPLGVPGVS
ncbi:hypothetical protein [Janibacter alittae]|uniref:Ferric siderophore reductase C-terminal domain-containing protein n=1 Tax=Janibacter alittae TaxID=3115209 RepID=A0ABZ2MI07_9MICO